MKLLNYVQIFTKTPLAKFNVLLFNYFRVSFPGGVSHRSSQVFQALRCRQFLHIAFVHDVDRDWRTLANSEPQTL